MPKSLAELRQSPHTALPERTYRICLSQALVGEAQALAEEKAGLEVAASRGIEDPDEAARIRKGGEGRSPRLAEIDARLEVIYDLMREHEGDIGLRGVPGGDWQRWCDAHPAREDGRDARGRPIILAVDDIVAYGVCDASALMARLGDFAVSWNGAPLETGDWAWLEEKSPPGDIKEMTRWVVQMHENKGAKALPKELQPSSTTEPSETA